MTVSKANGQAFTRGIRHFALASASSGAIICALASAAAAQTASVETVEVTGSRITASGFNAPTPTTVVSSQAIEENAQPNLFTTINQLPSLQGSLTSQSGQGSTSGGTNGLSAFSLHNLGTIRTLTLMDGERVVPGNVTGVADVSQFPQLLVQRVDVVSGGASASWGSDAVGGVINFITDKNFNGVKGNLQGGMSKYEDDINGTLQLAAGSDIFGGKGHIEAAVEYYRNDGILAPILPNGQLPGGRCCQYNSGGLNYTLTTTPAGVPENNRIINAQPTTYSEYGLITSAGALKGLQFNADGTWSPFQFGSPCVGTTCQGGDLTATDVIDAIDSPLTRGTFYTRLSYQITPSINVFGTYSFGDVYTFVQPGSSPNTAITIACGNATGGPNAYLSASQNAACVAAKITSFTIGETYDKIPIINLRTLREMRRYVVGADGAFGLFGSDWTWDSYYQHGENDSSIRANDTILPTHYVAAIDAVAGPNGTIVCRSTVAQAEGCVPFQIFGSAPITPQQQKWMMNVNKQGGPYQLTSYRQEAASYVMNGTPFKDWAGDVAIATGLEYREENYVVVADPYADGVTAINPNTPLYPADPLLAASNNWRAGNYHAGHGNYHVYEGFLEAGVPLFDDPTWGKSDAEIAGRETVYSTSGWVSTWKVGATWDTPIDGLRFRALQSRDVRAPNLSELFAAGTVSNGFVTDRTLPASAPQIQINSMTTGNPALQPEKAANTEIGLVYQPDFLPGFSISGDGYRINVKGEIGTISAQQTVDFCQLQNITAYCSAFFLKGTFGTTNPSYVKLEPFNLASNNAQGLDIETSYQFDLQNWDVPGSFVVRGLFSHVGKFQANNGIPGAAITETAGSSDPLWKANLSQSWRGDVISFNLTERWFSNGVSNPYGIVCAAPACPVPTAQHPTYAVMNTPGNLFLDVGGTYKITPSLQYYIKINNVADRLPGPIGGAGDDPIGRTYSMGIRIND